jgi:hypothetical protein
VTTSGQPHDGVPLDERSVVAARRGIPWWGAVLLAFAATGAGIAIDLGRGDTLTLVFLAFYAVGCVLAVLAVVRRGIFAAMVQPPLILAVAVPLVVKLLGSGTTGGLRNEVITLALPLVNGFPTMAVTTALTVGIGIVRLVVTRTPGRSRTHRRPTSASDADDQVRASPSRPAAGRSQRSSR